MGFVQYFLIYFVCAAALVVLVHGAGDTKKCIQCSDNTNCADPVDVNKTQTCDLAEGSVCERHSFKSANGILTVRGCVPNVTTCEILQKANFALINDNSTWQCYTCDSDLCNKDNSAASLEISMLSLVVAAVVGLYFK